MKILLGIASFLVFSYSISKSITPHPIFTVSLVLPAVIDHLNTWDLKGKILNFCRGSTVAI